MVVLGKRTREERKSQRAAVGSLESLIVKPSTLMRYRASLNRFTTFADLSELPLNSSFAIDSAAGRYVEELWQEGAGKAEALYALASLQYFVPQLRGHLPVAWRLMEAWDRHELPCRALPFIPQRVVAYTGLFWFWQEPDLAAGILLAFDLLLRTSELFAVRVQDVQRVGTQATVQLHDTKAGSLKLQSERLVVWERSAVVALQWLTARKQPGDFLLSTSVSKFRALWHKATKFFDLSNHLVQPYSLRRGGATSACRAGVSFDQLLVRGRWAHVKTARIP